jgi:hypothetical protein
VPDHTSLREIFYDVPRIEVESWETDKNYGLERGQASPTKLAELLSYYYSNREELDNAGQWCRNELLQDKYKWTTIVNQLEGIITRTLEEPTSGKGFGDD